MPSQHALTANPTGEGLLGAPAPWFDLPSGLHTRKTLADFAGTRLVLAFYRADWHPVCISQLGLLQAALPEFARHRAEVVGISADHVWSHQAFARAHGVSFPLLADRGPLGETARRFGVWDAVDGAAVRSLFVIDERGRLQWFQHGHSEVAIEVDGPLSILERLSSPVVPGEPNPMN